MAPTDVLLSEGSSLVFAYLWLRCSVTAFAHLRQLQSPHDGGKAEHVAHGALELGGDLDDLVQQHRSLLDGAGAAQQVHGQHGGHSLKPEGYRNSKNASISSSRSFYDFITMLNV